MHCCRWSRSLLDSLVDVGACHELRLESFASTIHSRNLVKEISWRACSTAPALYSVVATQVGSWIWRRSLLASHSGWCLRVPQHSYLISHPHSKGWCHHWLSRSSIGVPRAVSNSHSPQIGNAIASDLPRGDSHLIVGREELISTSFWWCWC